MEEERELSVESITYKRWILSIRIKGFKPFECNIKGLLGVSEIHKYLKLRVLERDKYTCVICGRHAKDVRMTIDHIIPLSMGGPTHDENLQTMCMPCNHAKEALMRKITPIPSKSLVNKLSPTLRTISLP
jgi:5-methylcytosine-specific restriction endonuclease McrA